MRPEVYLMDGSTLADHRRPNSPREQPHTFVIRGCKCEVRDVGPGRTEWEITPIDKERDDG